MCAFLTELLMFDCVISVIRVDLFELLSHNIDYLYYVTYGCRRKMFVVVVIFQLLYHCVGQQGGMISVPTIPVQRLDSGNQYFHLKTPLYTNNGRSSSIQRPRWTRY